jgi:U3 small nucleolar RNA-associated protein 22
MTDSLPAKRRKLDHAQDDENGALYAEGSYKSSMFKMQADEMLAEVQPNYEKRSPVMDDALRTLKGLIEGIEDREPLSVGAPKPSTITSTELPADSRSDKASPEVP